MHSFILSYIIIIKRIFVRDTGDRKVNGLWEELVKYSALDKYPFHMPGHKRCPRGKERESVWYKCQEMLENIYRYDITEIEGFDNLHDAKGLLLLLQQKAARVYQAEQSFFLVNGSTGGVLSAISAVAQEGKKLLVSRNCHKSVYNGVALNRLSAEYLWPEWIEEFDIQGEITAKQVEEHLKRTQDFCGVVITSPTYDGIISDIREIAEAVHACRIPLIVDEAHGAHFALSKKAPESAVECGADIVINSVHKTLPALTQTAILHVQGQLVDREKLERYLGIYQSSSPSYLFMASIDCCIDFIAEKGQMGYDRLLDFRRKIEESTEMFSHIRILPEGKRRDIGKLVISVKGTDMTGQELYQILSEQYHLQMEMAAPTYVLGILTVMDTKEGVDRLIKALREVEQLLSKRMGRNAEIKRRWEKDDICNIIPAEPALNIHEALQQKKELVFPKEAEGRTSGEFLYLYPPGIPFIVPGELFSEELILKIEQVKKKNGHLTGISEEGRLCVLAR